MVNIERVSKLCKTWVDDELLPLKGTPTNKQLKNAINNFFILNNQYQEFHEQVYDELFSHITTKSQKQADVLEDKKSDQWFEKNSSKINFERSSAFIGFQKKENILPPKVISQISDDTDLILKKLANPKSKNNDIRGLVYGKVQMGKTTNYSMLINKALDSGYKLIVVLSGTTNDLRRQTQIAIEENIVGKTTEEDISGETIGIKKYYDENSGKSYPQIVTLTNRKSDFTRNTAESATAAAAAYEDDVPFILCIKKNKSPLQELELFLKKPIGERFKALPLLLIDDEADQASVDTREVINAEEHNPTITNALIRIILSNFSVSSYVGYTATPYANIFINPDGNKFTFQNLVLEEKDGQFERVRTQTISEKNEDPLFPRNFIIRLHTPENYWGHQQIFRIPLRKNFENIEERGSIPQVIILEDLEKTLGKEDERQAWCFPRHPTGHIPQLPNGVRAIPTSLKIAIKSLILTKILKELRLKKDSYNTMLINTANTVAVHNEIISQVNNYRQDLVDRARSYDESLETEFKLIYDEYINNQIEFNRICEFNDKKIFKKLDSWDLVKRQLRDSIEKVTVIQLSGNHKHQLKDVKYKQQSLIIIGSLRLSRGLVIPELSISYFLRNSGQYDSLLQMGRWFGYRDSYMDLSRLYISSDLERRFTSVAEADEELEKEFDTMLKDDATPVDYGCAIAVKPELLITGRSKMRDSEELPLTFDNRNPQSNHLRWEKDIEDHVNEELVTKLVSDMNEDVSPIKKSVGYLWNNIDYQRIVEFLNDFFKSTKSTGVNWNQQIIDFIFNEARDNNYMENWTVCLRSNPRERLERFATNGLEVNKFIRDWGLITHNGLYQKQATITSPTDEMIDLTEEEKNLCGQENPRREARRIRPDNRALLLIWPMIIKARETDEAKEERYNRIGVTMSLPKIDGIRPRLYRGNSLWIKQMQGDD